ncbi:transposase [Alloalcanivorax venustensis]
MLPQARIVVDKFHVARMTDEALENLAEPEKSLGVDLSTFWRE